MAAPGGVLRVPAVRIEDAPRYQWRGLSVDVARHFVPVRDLKVVIGLMAHYKLNVLHLHLTDDQGWRLHVRSRPLLTRLSSSTSVDGDPGGFYTAEDYARPRRVRGGARRARRAGDRRPRSRQRRDARVRRAEPDR